MNAKTRRLEDESRITRIADGSERQCEGCGRSHFGINLEKRCGACFDEGKDFIVKACDACGLEPQIDKLMLAHDTAVHPPTPIYPGSAKTAEEYQKEFAALYTDGPVFGISGKGK